MLFLIAFRNFLLVAASLALLAGCSISYSSGKSSDSVTSSVSSGGGSKTAGQEISLYTEEVVALTDSYVRQGKNSVNFQHTITYIARTHGINDWEREESTFVAMGKGLKQAGVSEENIVRLPYFETLAKGSQLASLLKGFKE